MGVMVYGVDIVDDRMAGIARRFINSQVAILVVCVVSAVVSVVCSTMMMQGSFEKQGMPTVQVSPVQSIVQQVLVLCVVGSLIFLSLQALKKNHKNLLQGMCILEGIGMGCGIICSMVTSFIYIPLAMPQLMEHVCDNSAPNDQQSCKDQMDAMTGIFHAMIPLLIFAAVMQLVSALACGYGMYNTNKALSEVQSGSVFTGTAPAAGLQTHLVQP